MVRRIVSAQTWISFSVFVVALFFPVSVFASSLTDRVADCQSWSQRISGDSRVPQTCAKQTDGTYQMRSLTQDGTTAWTSDDGTCKDAFTNFDYYRCTQLIQFNSAPDASRIALCKTWTGTASAGNASYQRLYDTAGCDAYAADVRSTVTASTATKCKTYAPATSSANPVAMPQSIVSQYLFDPTCVKSGVAQSGCDSVQKSECAAVGSGSAADAISAVFGSQVQMEADGEVARGKKCVADAKNNKSILPSSITAAQGLVDAAEGMNKTLKDFVTVHGTEDGATGQAKALFQVIQTNVQSACDLVKPPSTQVQGSSTVLRNPLGTTDIPTLIGRLISAFLSVVGALTLLVFVYAGVKYLTAAGDSKQIQTAVDTMKYAFMGLAIIVFAYVISSFFFTTLLGS